MDRVRVALRLVDEMCLVEWMTTAAGILAPEFGQTRERLCGARVGVVDVGMNESCEAAVCRWCCVFVREEVLWTSSGFDPLEVGCSYHVVSHHLL